MIANNKGECTCDVCSVAIQIYATSVYSDRLDNPEIGDLINCPNCNVQYVFAAETELDNTFKIPNRFITKLR